MTRGRAATPLAPCASRTSWWWWRLIFAALVLASTGGLASDSAAAWRIVDGDTFDLAGERIRLFGIDAPEYGQSCGPLDCGEAAFDTLADILSAGPVRCDPVSTDRYGRSLARCRAGFLDVNREMIRRGMAWAFMRYADDYAADEKAARATGIGIWQHPSQPPWEYRAEKWDRAARKAPGLQDGGYRCGGKRDVNAASS